MEDVLVFDPDIIFISNFDDVTSQDFYENRLDGQDWSGISAVKNRRVYKVPADLYRWAPEEILEAGTVAIEFGGGPSMTYLSTFFLKCIKTFKNDFK